ncbi:40756_t:CDS:1 [Gigaspora margarita]|uniref:40756_t:CDS:1 n=1 Tax=Gigaspora margarita TaxID=4874 RepID=A0ABN7V7N7_GIGMA|nr:40756_t:CDS:1 [Gigaspora margarita]
MKIEFKSYLNLQNEADRNIKVIRQDRTKTTLPELVQQKKVNKLEDIQMDKELVKIEQESINLDRKTTYKEKEKKKATSIKIPKRSYSNIVSSNRMSKERSNKTEWYNKVLKLRASRRKNKFNLEK